MLPRILAAKRQLASPQPNASHVLLYNGAMSGNISATQLDLLRHLRDHSGVSGGRVGLDPKPIASRLRISMAQFAADSAALAALGLAGVRNQRRDANDVPSATCLAIWMTKKGEDYLRALPSPTTPSMGSG